MIRPRAVIEYGAGYSTPFLAQALCDNRDSFRRERALLIRKSWDFLDELAPLLRDGATFEQLPRNAQEILWGWVDAGGEATCLDPRFYIEEYAPRLLCFEELSAEHEYCVRIRRLLTELSVADVVRMSCGSILNRSSVVREQDAGGIDLAWNDFNHYREFFEMFWPRLNPSGGVMVFHYGGPHFEDDLTWMKEQRAEAGDLEMITLIEPQKLVQNGCFVLRRTSGCETSYAPRRNDLAAMSEVVEAMRRLVD